LRKHKIQIMRHDARKRGDRFFFHFWKSPAGIARKIQNKIGSKSQTWRFIFKQKTCIIRSWCRSTRGAATALSFVHFGNSQTAPSQQGKHGHASETTVPATVLSCASATAVQLIRTETTLNGRDREAKSTNAAGSVVFSATAVAFSVERVDLEITAFVFFGTCRFSSWETVASRILHFRRPCRSLIWRKTTFSRPMIAQKVLRTLNAICQKLRLWIGTSNKSVDMLTQTAQTSVASQHASKPFFGIYP